jgi:peptidoglycan/xylan/chitin deacetylase (PgdA/CDA1 family)
MLRNKRYKIIQWDVITYDWDKRHSADRVFEVIKRYSRPGSIIVMHDSQKAAARTLEILEDSIIWLKQQGYILKTLT